MTNMTDPSFDLVVEAGTARNEAELDFHMVNRSVAVVRYDRASVWLPGRKMRLSAVSGADNADPKGAFASTWGRALSSLAQPKSPGRISGDVVSNQKALALALESSGTTSAWWMPIPGRDRGILFERWGGEPFTDEEAVALERLVAGYALVKPGALVKQDRQWKRRLWRTAVLAIVAMLLFFVRLSLRVVAECEVVPKEPRIVTAPMDGVVEEVLVSPGDRVEAGTVLAVYDTRLMEEDLNVVRRQVEVVEAQLTSARARGLSDSRSRGDIALLEARLMQERARLQAMTIRFDQRRIVAPVSGMVQLDDARAWRGRPVQTGQAVLWLVQPDDSRADLWLPQDDRIDIDHAREVQVHLYALGGEPVSARLRYVSPFAGPGPGGIHAFPAEAEWLDPGFTPPLGLRGTAFLYGNEVSLGYWLLRRPLAWTRRWLGV